MVAELTGDPQSLLFRRSWALQLDSHHDPRGNRNVASAQARPNSWSLLHHCFRIFSLSNRLLHGLGWPLVFWQPLLRVSHGSLYSRPHGFRQLFRAHWNEQRAWLVAQAVTILLILWNFGLIFQWGTHLIPARGPISFREAAHNQVTVVPVQMAGTLKRYLTHRGQLMGNIEREDVRQLKSQRSAGSE